MKTALITGAAGGVGSALARALDRDGYDLVLADLDKHRLQETTSTLSRRAELFVTDLRNDEDVTKLCSRIESDTAPIDVLINNAGIVFPSSVSEISDDLLKAHIEINLIAPMLLSAAAAKTMKGRRSGQIFSIISLAGIVPLKDSAAYSASKFGLRGFMAALSLELKPYGVPVGGLFPGAVDTAMLAAEMANPAGSPLNFVGRTEPLSPDETAAAALKAMRNGKLETWLPSGEGRLGGFVMTFPSLLAPLVSYLEKQGEAKKQVYLQNFEQR